MSVICQNFVQNAWKKDLCSNCFKSVGDHNREDSFVRNLPPSKNEAISQPELANGRYSSSTCFNTRGFSGQTTWKSLLVERKDAGSQPFKLENGFHGKLLTINAGGPTPATNGTEDSSANRTPSVNGVKSSSQNGHETQSPPASVQGILKTEKKPVQRKSSVGFKEEEPMVIGYGGNDYDMDDHSWEAGSDEGGDSLDETEEDKVMSKITLENTEFNSNNVNLLPNKSDSCSNASKANSGVNGTHAAQNDICSGSNSSEASFAGTRDKNTPLREATTSQQEGAGENNGEKHEDEVTRDVSGGICESLSTVSAPRPVQGDSARKDAVVEATPTASDDSEREATCLDDSDAESNISSLTSLGSGYLSAAEDALPLTPDGESSQTVTQSQDEDSNKTDDQEKEEKLATSAENGEAVSEEQRTAEGSPPNAERSQFASDKDDAVPDMPLGVRCLPHVSARDSFLHGVASSEAKDDVITPNATYSPAADFFISRTSSSSSSLSSDDVSLSPDSISDPQKVAQSDLSKDASESVNIADAAAKPLVEAERPPSTSPRGNATKPEVPTTKPKVPAKPTKPVIATTKRKSTTEETPGVNVGNDQPVYATAHVGLEIADSSQSCPVSHYAESNIYHEVSRTPSPPDHVQKSAVRESKLAALAMELEQARCNSAMKRQAPTPPKVPDPPLEELPNSAAASQSSVQDTSTCPPARSQTMPLVQVPQPMTSSSLPGTSSNSKSYAFHPVSKSKSSFLLSQYSKCKMFAMGCAEDGAKSKKKFSLKKLWKFGKEAEGQPPDPNAPNPKAWKMNDFDRTKAKIEIIHPMDLIEKQHADEDGSTESLVEVEEQRMLAATPNDNHALFSHVDEEYPGGEKAPSHNDRATSGPEEIADGSYEVVSVSSSAGSDCELYKYTGRSSQMISLVHTSALPQNETKSPTPSRSSQSSVTGSTTSNSSKTLPARPPKPPPPPRAYSVLPAGRPDQSYLTKSTDDLKSCGDEPGALPPKPQVPKRQFRPSSRGEYANLGDARYPVAPKKPERVVMVQSNNECLNRHSVAQENTYDVLESCATYDDVQCSDDHVFSEERTYYEPPLQHSSSEERKVSSISDQGNTDSKPNGSRLYSSHAKQEYAAVTGNSAKSKIAYSQSVQQKKEIPYASTQGPVAKGSGPNRPPQPFIKSSICVGNSTEKPWLTLEASYSALSTTNYEMLAKLLEKGHHGEFAFIGQLKRESLRWIDFELVSDKPISTLNNKLIYEAVYRHSQIPMTLIVAPQHHAALSNTASLNRPILGHFNDNIRSNYIVPNDPDYQSSAELVASVYVIHRTEVLDVDLFLKEANSDGYSQEHFTNEISFIMLQVIHILKNLQAQGIETIDANFQNLLLARNERDKLHNVIFLTDHILFEQSTTVFGAPSGTCKTSLCEYALNLLLHLLKVKSKDELEINCQKVTGNKWIKAFVNTVNILAQEKAFSLSQAKTLLEYILWGSNGVMMGLEVGAQENEAVLQRWLDVERSHVLKNLVQQHLQETCVSVFDEFHLQYLVRTTAKNLQDLAAFM